MSHAVLTILLMAASTYLTRVLPYLFLQNRELSPRMLNVMQAVPGCVLLSVIAPTLLSGKLVDILAVAVTLLAVMRLSLFPAVLISIASTALLRHFL